MNANISTPDDNPHGDTEPVCARCGEPSATTRYRSDADDTLCDACDNYEPPAVTFEDAFGAVCESRARDRRAQDRKAR